MKIVSPKISPTFCPKLGEDQKQTSLPTICVLKAFAQMTKGGGGGGGRAAILHPMLCQLYYPGNLKGGMAQCPPTKYAPA